MKKIILIFIMLCMSMVSYAKEEKSPENKIRLAVIPFDDSITLAGENEKAAKNIAASMEGLLGNNERFYLRPANAIGNYIETLTKVQLGLANPDSIKDEGKKLLVNYLTVGSISKFGERYEVDARIVNINDWRIVHSYGATGSTTSGTIKSVGNSIEEKFTLNYLNKRLDDKIDRPTVSVYKFKEFNTRPELDGISGAFAEMLNSQMGEFMEVNTIELKFAKALVDEKQYEMAGVIENDNSNASYNNKGIQYKVSGDIRVFPDVICINYTIHNTSDSKVISISSIEVTSSAALRTAAWSAATEVEQEINSRVGAFKLSSKPAGAKVFIDEEPFGSTPATLYLDKGVHNLRLTLQDYETHEEKIEILPRKVNQVNVNLKTISLQLLEKAFSLESEGNCESAVKCYNDFIAKYDKTTMANQALYRKGHLELLKLKRPKDAMATFNTLLKSYPETMIRAEGYYGLALTYFAIGEIEKAKETVKFLLEKYRETSAAEEARKIKF